MTMKQIYVLYVPKGSMSELDVADVKKAYEDADAVLVVVKHTSNQHGRVSPEIHRM